MSCAYLTLIRRLGNLIILAISKLVMTGADNVLNHNKYMVITVKWAFLFNHLPYATVKGHCFSVNLISKFEEIYSITA